MPTSTYDTLLQAGYSPSQSLLVRKILATHEEGKRYALQISNNKESVLFQVDGTIIKTGEKCDKLVQVKLESKPEKWAQIFVELKGHDVSHALTQLIETAKQKIFCHSTNTIKRACVVATSFPTNKANPEIEKKIIELGKMQFQLKKLKSGQTDNI